MINVRMKFGTVEPQTKMVPENGGLTCYSRRIERDRAGNVTHVSEWEALSHIQRGDTYPKLVRCRWTGIEAFVDGRPAEIAFRLMAPCIGFAMLLVTLVLVLAILTA